MMSSGESMAICDGERGSQWTSRSSHHECEAAGMPMRACSAAERRRKSKWVLVGALALLTACAPGEDAIGEARRPTLRGATLTVIDSLDLQETDSVFASKVNAIVLQKRGQLLVADAGVGRVLEYSRDGRLLRTFGRRGKGPGEFSSPSWMVVLGDSLLLVKNGPAFRIEAFDLRSGAWLWGRRFDAKTTTGLAAVGDTVVMGLLDAGRGSSFVSFSDSGSALQPHGRLPSDAHGDPLLTDAFRLTQLAARGDTIAQAYEVSNWLFVLTMDGSLVDSVHIPVARRKGAPVKLLPLLRANQELGIKAVNHVSQPQVLQWIGEGIIGLVTVDPDRTGARFRGPAFLSVIDLRTRRACVDAPLPVPEDPPPATAWSGDTLLMLYQDVSRDGRPVARVKRARVDLATCEWSGEP